MHNLFSVILFGLGIILGGIGIFVADADASGGGRDFSYAATLKIANEYAKRKKDFEPKANAISSAMLRSLYGRFYQVGDHWDVLAIRMHQAVAKMTGEPDQLQPTEGEMSLFRYTVTGVKTGLRPEVELEITPLDKNLDPRVEKISIKMNDRLVQNKKVYSIKDKSGAIHQISVSPDGLRSQLSILDLFPLDVPDVSMAEKQTLTHLPALPSKMQKMASQLGYHPDLSHSSWFDQDDFFGRPVEILWQQGDPWPAYLSTTSGVAILISKGTS